MASRTAATSTELTLGLGLAVNHKRVARLMREAGIQGLYRRRRHGCTVRDPAAGPYPDLVDRQFAVDGPDHLWFTDITEHPTGEGKLYCAAVLDAYSRESLAGRSTTTCASLWSPTPWGWPSPADDPRTVPRSCIPTTGRNSYHGRSGNVCSLPGLLGSMGSIGDCYDNSMMESFWGTMQLELLDSRNWATRVELANAIFEWLECWYNPKRRHSSIGMLSPLDHEAAHTKPDQDH